MWQHLVEPVSQPQHILYIVTRWTGGTDHLVCNGVSLSWSQPVGRLGSGHKHQDWEGWMFVVSCVEQSYLLYIAT